MNKILEGTKHAVWAAQCDHELVPMSTDVKNPDKFDKFYCRHCRTILYIPTVDQQFPKEG